MGLTHHSYIFCAVIFKFLVDTQVEAISFSLGLGAIYFGSEVYAETNCDKAEHQKFDSPCYVAEGEAFLCDHKEFLRCSNGTCVCFRSYSYNSISKKCEPDHSKHLVRRKREPGKALPGETCHLSGDCVEGLYCIGDKCKCPNPCEYKKDEGVCDCGEIDYEFPTAPKVVTILLCTLSAFVWTYFILKTKNKKKNTQTNPDENFDVNGPLEMNPLNQPSKPEVGENNFLVPSDLPPSYQESMEERKDCAPFYPPSNAPVANNTSAWNVTPMPGPQNTNTSLTSQYPVGTPYSYGAISDGTHSNDVVSSSSVLSPENVTLVDTSKSQGATLPYPVSSPQNIPTPFPAPFAGVHSTASSDATHPFTSEGTSLPYAINPQTMSSTLPPPPTSTGVPATTSTNATYPNNSEGTSLPYSINPPSAPPPTTEN
ncbi:UNVERIFIED_CONTAM: hypothetical protein RMT77_010911 [Armadillidium vulgare]